MSSSDRESVPHAHRKMARPLADSECQQPYGWANGSRSGRRLQPYPHGLPKCKGPGAIFCDAGTLLLPSCGTPRAGTGIITAFADIILDVSRVPVSTSCCKVTMRPDQAGAPRTTVPRTNVARLTGLTAAPLLTMVRVVRLKLTASRSQTARSIN